MLRICCAQLPIKQIVDKDLSDLKGKWEGIRNSTGKYSSEVLLGLRTGLEIKNDSLPLRASFCLFETKKGIAEYPILLDITEGKLASKKHSVVLTFCRKRNRLRLEGRMEVGNYYEELVFWKNTQTSSFQSLSVSQPPRKLLSLSGVTSPAGLQSAKIKAVKR